MLTSEMVKKVAKSFGADAVGVGSMDRFEGAPPEMDPRYVFPEAKAVVGMVFRIPRGYQRPIEEGTQFFQYPWMGYGAINETFAPTVLYETGRFIEDHGYEAAVYRNTGGRGSVSDMTGDRVLDDSPELRDPRMANYCRGVRPGVPAPDVQIHFRIAAFICGLGEIGYSKMFLSPQFGPFNRQAFLFTDAPLEPDPLYSGPALCDQCMACVAQCPGKCRDREHRVKVTVAGRPLEWGELDTWKCMQHYMCANPEFNPFLPADPYAGIPNGEAFARGDLPVKPSDHRIWHGTINQHYPAGPAPDGYGPAKCGGCLRACIASMERRGVLQCAFKSPFRTGKPWRLKPHAAAQDK